MGEPRSGELENDLGKGAHATKQERACDNEGYFQRRAAGMTIPRQAGRTVRFLSRCLPLYLSEAAAAARLCLPKSVICFRGLCRQ